MEVQTIAQLISTLGFPIVCTCALFWLNIKQDERHRIEVQQLTEAITNNTTILNLIKDRLGADR